MTDTPSPAGDTVPPRLAAALDDRYRVERELGVGGMATVYLAADIRHNRKVAIKVLKPELAAVVGSDRFLAEIETTAALQHPHILPLFDSGDADGFLFYVMPFVDGESLRDRLDRDKQLPVDEAVGLAAKVAGALKTAHAAGVIHRDIKPANILLANGEPLIADFGIALAVQEAGGGRLTETGLSVGTPFYMSPEQATADRMVTPSTDIYALGCVLYEMLVGEPPYVGNTAQAVLGKILTGDPRRPTAVRPRIPANVEAAVLCALEKLPADRFGSAGEFIRALEDPRFRHGEAPESSSGSAAVTSRLWPAVAAVLAIVCIGLIVLRPGSGEPPPTRTIRLQIPVPEDLSVELSSGVGLDVSPTGDAVVFRAGENAVTARLWLHRLDRLDPEPLPGTQQALNPRFSPDGQAVAFQSQGAVRRIGLDGSPPLTLVPEGVQQAGLAWGEDGFVYFQLRGNTGFHRVPADGGAVEPVPGTNTAERRLNWPHVLPGGKGILANLNFGGPSSDSLVVYDLESGESRVLVEGSMARWSDSGHLLYTAGEGTLMALPFDLDELETTGAPSPLMEGVRVNTGSAAQFAVSRSGTLVYGAGRAIDGGVLSWLSPEGLVEIPAFGGQRIASDYDVSPDGRKVAMTIFSSSSLSEDIWVLDLDAGVFSRLTFSDDNMKPFWHPDSEIVGFMRQTDDGGVSGLYARPIDLGQEAELLWTPRDSLSRPFLIGAWSPDGSRLVVNVGADSLVSVAPHPDSLPQTVLAPPGSITAHEISPNGDWIAYTTDESGGSEVYLRPFPGPGGQRQISSGGGMAPRWLRSGDGLVYTDPTSDVWMLARLVSPDDPRPMSTDTYLVTADPSVRGLRDRDWELGADGRILVTSVERGYQRPPIIVTNWVSQWAAEAGR